MPAVSIVAIPLFRDGKDVDWILRIALLPRGIQSVPPALLDERENPEADSSVAPIQLLESHEYRYEWQRGELALGAVTTDPEEIFQPDDEKGMRGRLRPGLATGLLRVTLRSTDTVIGEIALEVRSRKLEYRSEYRWMLRDIADQMSELVMQRFASASAHFEHDSSRDATTLYQRFEFLRALLSSDRLQAAIQQVRSRPHVAWEDEQELIHPGQTLRASSRVARSLSCGGRRSPWPDGPVASIPAQLHRFRTEATHDTTPNRFVRFALERWRQVVRDIQSALSNTEGIVQLRGMRETTQILDRLDEILHDDLFKEAGALSHFPADNQVLHRREGYRDIFRAYVEFELAARLSWKRDDSAFEGRQRDVAQLYEYWAFLRLAQVIAGLIGSSFDMSSVLELDSDGLNIGLRNGRHTVLSGIASRHGRRLHVDFSYNRTFGGREESWTVAMRPDYSLVISPAAGEPASFEPVILHFDAKYRISTIEEIVGSGSQPDSAKTDEHSSISRRGAKRDDLLKMHSYRDAIRRTAGAYVLYPGDEVQPRGQGYHQYREILPGLGAFILRPSSDGEVAGVAALREFLDKTLDHIAERFSRHERGRYWIEDTHGSYDIALSTARIFPFGTPNDDTTVLLGYVKNMEHWSWIQNRRTYNVRAKDRPGAVSEGSGLLYSQLILLYGPTIDRMALARIISIPERASAEALRATGYPGPRGDYLCVQLGDISPVGDLLQLTADLANRVASQITGRVGHPVAISWGKLCRLDFLDSPSLR